MAVTNLLLQPRAESAPRLRPEKAPNASGRWRLALLLIVPAVVAAYLLENLRYPGILSPGLTLYLAEPVTWTAVGLLAYLAWRFGLRASIAPPPGFISLGALLGTFQVAVLVIAGLIFGFGYSPYGRTPVVLVGNLFYVLSVVVGVELARACLIRLVGRARPLAGILSVSLLFALVGIPLARLTTLASPLPAFQLGGELFLPLFAQNLLATLLALLGGPFAAIAYRAVLEIFEWTAPILPNLPWAATALLGTMLPVLGMLMVQSRLRPAVSRPRAGAAWPSAWLLPAFLGVVLIWFNQGFFGVTPTVVSGVSMAPMLQAGDLVLTRAVDPADIAVGDILRIRSGEDFILHRVVAIREADGLEFVTRGDANNVDDPAVPASAVEGRVVRVFPGLGWPSFVVRQGLQWILAHTES